MRRRIVAGALVLVVPVATILGLFVHAHPDDHATDHHEGRAVHAHGGGHTHAQPELPAPGPAVDADDDHDRAVYVGAYVAEAIASFRIVATVPPALDVPLPAARRAQPPVLVVHGHDPPVRALLPSRAPPRLPVLI